MAVAFASALCCFSATAAAQSMPREPNLDEVRIRMGGFFVNPTFALTNLGVDTNVFNAPDDGNPQSDFTITITPAADLWLRFGRTWLAGTIKEDLVWYQEFESERSVNQGYTASWLIPLNRLTFAVGGNFISTRERPGFEIDARSQRYERAPYGIVEIRALSKTFVGVRGERRKVEYDKDEVFNGANLANELNRTVSTTGVSIRNQLTPLTSVAFIISTEQDRFEYSPLRDSDSTRYDVAVTFDPYALIKGSAQVGYRDFRPLSNDLPGYSGSTAAVSLSYVALGSTRLALTVDRDVEYSFDINQPYYVQTGFLASVEQQIYGPVDVQARVGAQRLAYADREGADVAVSDRIDRVRTWGFGFGYRMGRDLRFGFNIDDPHRISEIDSREYNGLRYGFSVTYGL